MDLVLVLAVLALLLLAVVIGCLLADRSARKGAWERIIEERRGRQTPPEDPH